MRFFILLLILALFLQTSFLPLNLVLILIISRSFVLEDLSNFYLAFLAGIFLSILAVSNLGYWPLLLLIIVELIYLSKKLPLSKNILTVIFISFILLFGVDFLQSKIFHHTFEVSTVVTETIVLTAAYYLLKLWERRFIVKHEVKLKIRD